MNHPRYRLPGHIFHRIKQVVDNTPSVRLRPANSNPHWTKAFEQKDLGRFSIAEGLGLDSYVYIVQGSIHLSPKTGLSQKQLQSARGQAIGTITLYLRNRPVAYAILQVMNATTFACTWTFWYRSRVPTGELKIHLEEV